jgi:uncharacterized membrane protein (UPF0136 family)
MKNIVTAFLVFGILDCLGGVIGHLKAQSLASLVMGGLSGLALLACAVGILKSKIAAYYTSMAITTALSAFFIYRFLHTWKVMPAGLMTVISLAVLSILLVNFFSINRQTERM